MKYIALITILLTLSLSTIATETENPCKPIIEELSWSMPSFNSTRCTQDLAIHLFELNEETGECDLVNTIYQTLWVPCRDIPPAM